jgi:alpha/beta superfamily hydrolase
MAHDIVTQERVWITGPRGRMCGELAYPDGAILATALLVGPHPFMGGRMDNNVIAALARELPHAGIVALRFDYAGIGCSEGLLPDVAGSMDEFWATGRAPEDPLMVEDARTCLSWLTEQEPDAPTVIIGYSFGAWATVQITPHDASAMVLVSPTLEQHDFSRCIRLPMPKLIVYSENDFATKHDRFQEWQRAQGPLTRGCRLDGADHFYRGREDQLAAACTEFIAACVQTDATTP